MQIQERSYSGKSFRPKPQFLALESSGLFVISTAWGPPEIAQRNNQLLLDFLQQGFDEEATRVGVPKDSISESVFQLKSAMTAANDQLLKVENKNSYQVIIESSAFFLKGNTLSWAQVGGPHILASNPRGLQPIAYELDWAWQKHQGSPLVTYGLGLEKNCQINSGSLQIDKDTFVTLLERSYIPSSFFTAMQSDMTPMTQCLVADASEVPFWLGVMTF